VLMPREAKADAEERELEEEVAAAEAVEAVKEARTGGRGGTMPPCDARRWSMRRTFSELAGAVAAEVEVAAEVGEAGGRTGAA